MKINAKKEGVELQADGSYIVRVNAPPIEGKANVRVMELLAENFKKPKSAIEIVSGHRGKKKVFKIS